MSDTKLIVGSVVFSSGLPLGGEGAMYAAGQPARDLAAAKTEIATLRAALAERQAAINELVACKDLREQIDALDAVLYSIADADRADDMQAEYNRRKPLAWSAARALVEKS